MHDHAYGEQVERRQCSYVRSCKKAPASSSDRLGCTIMHLGSPLSGRIAAEVRRARSEQQLRQDELALAAGVSVRAIHQIEAGKPTTRLDILERVLDALG